MRSRKFLFLPCALLLLAAIFLIGGLLLGQHTEVWNKAIRICLECIGIG